MNCPKCRKRPEAVTRGDEAANQARKQSQRRNERAGAWAAKTAAPTHELKILALSLAQDPDPVRACEAAGLARSPDEAARMADAARACFPGLCDGGDMSAIRLEVRAAYGRYALELSRRIHDMPPSQLPNALRALDQAHASLAASDGAPRYTTIEMSVIGPDGQKVRIE